MRPLSDVSPWNLAFAALLGCSPAPGSGDGNDDTAGSDEVGTTSETDTGETGTVDDCSFYYLDPCEVGAHCNADDECEPHPMLEECTDAPVFELIPLGLEGVVALSHAGDSSVFVGDGTQVRRVADPLDPQPEVVAELPEGLIVQMAVGDWFGDTGLDLLVAADADSDDELTVGGLWAIEAEADGFSAPIEILPASVTGVATGEFFGDGIERAMAFVDTSYYGAGDVVFAQLDGMIPPVFGEAVTMTFPYSVAGERIDVTGDGTVDLLRPSPCVVECGRPLTGDLATFADGLFETVPFASVATDIRSPLGANLESGARVLNAADASDESLLESFNAAGADVLPIELVGVPLAGAWDLETGDFDGDETLDLVFVVPGALVVVFRDGESDLSGCYHRYDIPESRRLTTADLTGDGTDDILVGNRHQPVGTSAGPVNLLRSGG